MTGADGEVSGESDLGVARTTAARAPMFPVCDLQSSRRRDDSGNPSEETKMSQQGNQRGFANLDPEQLREISSAGGRAAHANGSAHEWSSEEAREAGQRGGRAAHHHDRAAFHYETAAHHHSRAATHHGSGSQQQARLHAEAAHGHEQRGRRHGDEAHRHASQLPERDEQGRFLPREDAEGRRDDRNRDDRNRNDQGRFESSGRGRNDDSRERDERGRFESRSGYSDDRSRDERDERGRFESAGSGRGFQERERDDRGRYEPADEGERMNRDDGRRGRENVRGNNTMS